MNGAQVKQMLRENSSHTGEWYVCRETGRRGLIDNQQYLHADGVWRSSAYHLNKPTGWFKTEGDAVLAMIKANAEGNPVETVELD